MLVEFTLETLAPDRTRLRVVETGLEQLDWPDDHKARYAQEHRAGWETIADRLAGLLGGGSADRSR